MFRVVKKDIPAIIEKEVWIGKDCVALTEPPLLKITENQKLIDEIYASDNSDSRQLQERLSNLLFAIWGIPKDMSKDLTVSQGNALFSALAELGIFAFNIASESQEKNDQTPPQ